MHKIKALAVLAVFFLFFTTNVCADTIHLKNGKSLQGLISKEDKNVVEVHVGGGTVVFQASEIERIERSTPQEIEAIKKDWEMEKSESEKTRADDQAEKEKSSARWEAMVAEERRLGEERRQADANIRTVPVASDRGHIFVDAVLNGDVHASLIIDTGCPSVLLTASMGRKLGLDLENVRDAREVMVLDGKHRVLGTLLKSVRLGDVEEKNIMADVLLEDTPEVKQSLRDGLLGMSFLKRFNVTLDQKKMKLIFKPHL